MQSKAYVVMKVVVLAIERRGALPRASEINRHYNDIAVPSFILPGAPNKANN